MTGQWHIPDDWDGQWQCIQIQWPKSKKYDALLRSILYELTRGKTYDGDTGSIKNAQIVGWKIFNKNHHLNPCNSGSDSVGLPAWPAGGATDCSGICDDDECNQECDDMGCCIQALEWRQGVLYALMCGEWRVVEGSGGIVNPASGLIDDEDTETTPVDPSDPVQVANFACAKAQSAVNMVWAVMNAVLNHASDYPWQYVSNIESEVHADLDNKHLAIAWLALVGGGMSTTDVEEIITRENKQEWACWLAGQLDGTTSAATDEDIEAILRLPYHGGHDIMERGYIDACVRAVGVYGYNQAFRLACADPTYDCACPDLPPEIPVDYDWIHVYNFAVDDYGWSIDPGDGAYVPDVGFRNTIQQYANLPQVVKQATAEQPNENAYLRYWQLSVEWPDGPNETADSWAFAINTVVQFPISPYWDLPFPANVANHRLQQNATVSAFRGQLTSPQASGTALITKLIIAGTGDDPFPGDPVA